MVYVKGKIFRHAVGKSTFEEGFAIPKAFEDWIKAPPKGEKRNINLFFENSHITAVLRRVNNQTGNVQIKYSNRYGLELRVWLKDKFNASMRKPCGEYFELTKIDDNNYKIQPNTIDNQKIKALSIPQLIFHKRNSNIFEKEPTLREILSIVRCVEIVDNQGQSYYNHILADSFKNWQWEAEKLVIPELGLKCDFVKEGIHVEVDFGNARSYYQNYVKFLIAYNNKLANIGVLLVPTSKFAKQLCSVGRQHVLEKGKKGCYSGMIDFEKIYREYKYIKFMLSMPLIVAGIDASL